MRFLFISANLGAGGAERVMSLLANRFVEKADEVEFVFLKNEICFYPINKEIKITLAEKECHSDSMIQKLWWMRKYISRQNFDVVFAFRISVYCATLFSLLGTKVPVIASERIDPRYNSIPEKILQRILLPFANHLVVQTSEIKKYYPGFIQKKTSVIFNPVDERVFGLQTERKEKRIISVGRLYPQKNQKMMIDAFSRIAPDFPDWKLIIFGEGPLRETLETQIKRLKTQDNVRLPGRSESVLDELNRSEVFCFSSDYEGMSNAIVEAFCIGLPIVSTKVSGTEDFIKNGENGILINIGKTDEMEAALSIIMSDESLRKKMAEKNCQQSSIFQIEHIFQQWENVINKVVNQE